MRILGAIVLPESLFMRAGQPQTPERRGVRGQLVGHLLARAWPGRAVPGVAQRSRILFNVTAPFNPAAAMCPPSHVQSRLLKQSALFSSSAGCQHDGVAPVFSMEKMTTTSNDFDICANCGQAGTDFPNMKNGPSRSSCVGGLGETVAPIEQGSGVATVTSLGRDWSGL
jgi:hypothetical protein